ncbi:FKBP-type peptidyl-prolyl cis-trans isomerase [Poriferisphaera sp. WC338]|uniref:FKBP-type peptidyl-prolyl cis-trans isomerase n=1 Tax=Poriferisphaera sp. WC338 TaxID=3425129 RepID=UPI003D8169B9
MPIIVNSPFSGKPVKVRDEDVGRAIRDEENRIFYVVQRSDGDGVYGSPTRKGSPKDEQRYLDMLDKLERNQTNVQTQIQAVHDASGKKRNLSLTRVLIFLILLAIVAGAAWYFLAGGQDFINQKLNPTNAPPIIEQTDDTALVMPPRILSADYKDEEGKAGLVLASPAYQNASPEPTPQAANNTISHDPPDKAKQPTRKDANNDTSKAANEAAFVVLPSGLKYWVDTPAPNPVLNTTPTFDLEQSNPSQASETETAAPPFLTRPARAGDYVVIEYKAWLPGGLIVDASTDTGPIGFVLWSGQAIRGWDEGITGMRVGERRTLIIPPNLVHGPNTSTKLGADDPQNQNTLMCEILLRDLQEGVTSKRLIPGNGMMARPGDEVVVEFLARIQGKDEVILSWKDLGEPLRFRIGEHKVITGLELGVTGMTVGESRRLTVPPYLAYGSRGFGNLIPGDATLVYDVTLRAITVGYRTAVR